MIATPLEAQSSKPPGVDMSAFTDSVIASIGEKASPRVKQAFPILIRKMHEFCIEADVTTEEWLETCNLLVRAGQISSEKRNELVLVSDVFGIESLVDTLGQLRAMKTGQMDTTSSAILGPFYREGVPAQVFGTSIVRRKEEEGGYTHLYGTIFDEAGKPAEGAILDVWHDAPSGLYDAQDETMPEYHCRGRFVTGKDGKYDLICLRPSPYPIPYDSSTGDLLKMMDRHPMRPAHIHYMVQLPSHKTLVTQLYDRESKYLKDDAVFGVKDDLILDFVHYDASKSEYKTPADYDGQPIKYEVKYDVSLLKHAV